MTNNQSGVFYKLERIGKIADWTVKEDDKNEEDDGFSIVDRQVKALKSLSVLKKTLKKEIKKKPLDTKKPVPVTFGKRETTSIQVNPKWKKVNEIELKRLEQAWFVPDSSEVVAASGTIPYFNKQFDRKKEIKLPNTKMGMVPTTKEDETLMNLPSNDRVVIATDQILSTLMTCTKSVYSWDLILSKQGNKIVIDKRNGGVIDFVTVNENADLSASTTTTVGQMPQETEGVNGRGALSVEATRIQSKVRAAVVDKQQKVQFEQPPASFVKKLEELKNTDGGSKRPMTTSDSFEVEEGYTYRKIWMDTFALLTRCTVHAAVQTTKSDVDPTVENALDSSWPKDETQLVNIYAVHEWEKQALGYRKGLDGQRGALLATELKQNWTRIARWVSECELAGVNMLKLAFVTRNSWSSRNDHTLLGVVTERIETLKGKMALETEKGMGIIKGLCDLWFGVKVVRKAKDIAEDAEGEEADVVEGQEPADEELIEVQEGGLEDGVYCIVKDAHKAVLSIYKVQESEVIN